MKPQNKPLHLNADVNEIAPLVLFPGDPLRAKYIAENFLENAELVTSVRNMYGYTGYYKGKRVSVISSGMGVPSAGIYLFELFHFYNVEKLIRIGTCGAVSKDLKLLDIVLSKAAYSTTDYGMQFCKEDNKLIEMNKNLNDTIKNTAKELDINITEGITNTTSVFGPYGDTDYIYSNIPKDINIIAEEMEGYAVGLTAQKMNREATVLLSITDSPYTKDVVSTEDRQTALNKMITLALESIIK